MNVTRWSNGLEVTGDGTGIVSHAGLGLLRRLADKTGLTRGLSKALPSGRVLGRDRVGHWPISRAWTTYPVTFSAAQQTITPVKSLG